MARNHIIAAKTANDIDRRVKRVLWGLAYPEPPLCLEDVLELLQLDLEFYTADNPSVVKEVISRMRVAGIQVYRRPTLLIDAINKSSLKALYLPDRKRILLDKTLPKLKHRWNEAHEIGHSIIPWHHDVMFGDNRLTLSQDCQEHVEAEANFAAGRLLFLGDRFSDEAESLEPSIATIRELKKTFGNTLSTTLYRFVESVGDNLPIVGMITGHPHPLRRSGAFDPLDPCRRFIRSPAFARQFRTISEAELFAAVAGYCGTQGGGPLGEDEVVLTDDNGDCHRFYFETFFNRYDALTLGRYLQPVYRAMPIST